MHKLGRVAIRDEQRLRTRKPRAIGRLTEPSATAAAYLTFSGTRLLPEIGAAPKSVGGWVPDTNQVPRDVTQCLPR
jgi:hypothetical protein